jgi:hypothetical protein
MDGRSAKGSADRTMYIVYIVKNLPKNNHNAHGLHKVARNPQIMCIHEYIKYICMCPTTQNTKKSVEVSATSAYIWA